MVTLDVVIASVVIHLVHFRGIGEDARFTIADHGVVFPASFPELVEHVEIFVGAVIAFIVCNLPGEAHRARRAVQVPGHDVPANPPVAQMIERGETSCEQVGRFVREVHRNAEAKVARDRGHGRDQHHGIVDGKLDRLLQGQIGRLLIDIVDADYVRNEEAIEQSFFEQLCKVGPV